MWFVMRGQLCNAITSEHGLVQVCRLFSPDRYHINVCVYVDLYLYLLSMAAILDMAQHQDQRRTSPLIVLLETVNIGLVNRESI